MLCLRGRIVYLRVCGRRYDPTGQMRLLIAEQNKDGQKRLVAGSLLLQFGQTVFYAFTGCAPDDFCLHPHDILQIEAIRGACKNGFRWYDFGEVTEDHEALGAVQNQVGRRSEAALSLLLSRASGARLGRWWQSCAALLGKSGDVSHRKRRQFSAISFIAACSTWICGPWRFPMPNHVEARNASSAGLYRMLVQK